jgi:hypothetical protein
MRKHEITENAPRKLKKFSRNAEWILVLSVFIPIFGGMIWIIFDKGDVHSYMFWIAAIIEVLLAYKTATLKKREYFIVIFMISFLTPYFRLPLNMVWMVYLLAGAMMAVYTLMYPRKPVKKPVLLDTQFIVPQYVPTGYKEADRKTHKRKDNRILEIIFDNDDDEHIIWLMESEKPFSDEKPMKNSETSLKTINAIPVQINREVPKKPGKPNDSERFIEANWQYKSLYFNLRSDGLQPGEMENIIASMTELNE